MAGQLQEFANIMEEVAEESFCYEALGERKTKAIIQGLMAEGIQVETESFIYIRQKQRAAVRGSQSAVQNNGKDVRSLLHVFFPFSGLPCQHQIFISAFFILYPI